MSTTTDTSSIPSGGGHRPPPPRRERPGSGSRGSPAGATCSPRFPWIGPALILIFGVVLFPAVVMFFNSTRDISISGVDKGSVGLDNYIEVFTFPYFWPIFGRTIVWVVVVVGATVLISLGLAQILDKAFPGRASCASRSSCRGRHPSS